VKKVLKIFVLVVAVSMLFAACDEAEVFGNRSDEIAASEDTSRNTGQVTRRWNFQNTATNLVEWNGNDSSLNSRDISYTDSMTLLGSQRSFRWVRTQASPGSGATAGCIQPNGATSSGRYFLQIANVQGPFSITLLYTDTGSGNSGRNITFFTNGTSRGTTANTSGLTLRTHTFNYTGTDRVTVQLGCNNAIRLFDVSIVSTIRATAVNISPSGNFSIAANATRQLSATTNPADALNTVTWASSNTNVATVSTSGLVTGRAAGTATITATASDGSNVRATVTATVTAASGGGTTTTPSTPSTPSNTANVTRWNFQASATGLSDYATNGSVAITANVAYQNNMTLLGSQRDFRWLPNQAAPTGNSNVTRGCVQTGGATASGRYFLQIANVQGPFKITLYYTDTSSNSGRTANIFINGTSVKTGTGTNGTNLVSTDYTHNQNTSVTVQLGCSGGIRLYDVVIERLSSTSGGGTTTTPSTPSTPSTVLVTGITLSTGNFSLAAGSTRAVTATVAPTNATNRNVTWSSSNTSVATVNSSGTVTGVSAGTATITARAADTSGRSASLTATITGSSSSGGSGTTTTTGSVSITRSQGWLESAFVQWNKVSGASSYRVEYQRSGGSWIRIDNQLIREYPNHFRADAVGLSSGTYSIRVAAVNSAGTVGSWTTASNLNVQSYMRTGMAFSSASPNRNSNGAYNQDGTLKSGAQVIYVTSRNAKTVTHNVAESASKTTQGVGIGKILSLRQKGYDTTPLAIRFIGRIDNADISSELGSNALLQVKGKSSATPMNMTVEGIGNDMVAYGWGVLVRNSLNVEVRNMGFMMFPEDGVSLDTDNKNIWIHNNDFFYGRNGGGDKNKGDGALDSKKSGFVTISFNHFWDSGKANLCGNGTEPVERLTYHHNWFDHSDSRHPRVRFHSVHVFNNYYDGISKYGIGATRNSSVFSDSNYFRNSKNPMLISMQGSDIASGSGSFSSEDGGIIKAFNNFMDDNTRRNTNYRPWSSSNSVEFDAYEVSSRTASVPNTVRTKKGGFTYNNFCSNLGYSPSYDSPTAARDRVIQFAGRMQGRSGSDFTWWSWTSGCDTSSDINSGLNNAVQSYSGRKF